MINRELIVSEWSENVVPLHKVPQNLFPHQVDAMALIKDGNHVFLGNILPPSRVMYINISSIRCPNRFWENSATAYNCFDDARYCSNNYRDGYSSI